MENIKKNYAKLNFDKYYNNNNKKNLCKTTNTIQTKIF